MPAGDFSAWLRGMQGALRGEHGSDVPCGSCTACCRSSQFIHIEPGEADALANIPPALLFPAPGLPRGNVLLGYDERGHCPMLVDDRCSIYEHRPLTCRTFDCRVAPAAGVVIDDDKPEIARRARRWEFTYPSDADRCEHDAVRAAASYLEECRSLLPTGTVPTSATQLAAVAIEIHDAFLERDAATGRTTLVVPDAGVVDVALTRRRGPRPRGRGEAGER